MILDVRLPDGSGFDFFRQMRQMRLRQPISILTARREEADEILGLEIGADDYLTKPYSPGELLAWVRALLRRAYGGLGLRERQHSVRRRPGYRLGPSPCQQRK